MLRFSVFQIAGLLGGKVEGNGEKQISMIAKIEEAEEGSISFLANPKYESYLYTTQASAVIVSHDFIPAEVVSATLIRVEDPYLAFTILLNKVQEQIQKKSGIEEPSFIAPNAKVGKEVYIGAFSYVGYYAEIGDGAKIYPGTYIGDGVKVGKNTVIYPNVTIYGQSIIGENCILHAGSVIGSDGFGHAPQPDGSYMKVPQTGNVVLGNAVEVGANTTIDKATLGSTIVGDGVKLDNLIQIAHNVSIGKNTVIAALTAIAGSTAIGSNCMLGGQVGIVGHIRIADGVKIGAKSGVSKNIKEENTNWRGAPVQEYRQQLKSEAVFRQLDSLLKRVAFLEKKLSEKEENSK